MTAEYCTGQQCWSLLPGPTRKENIPILEEENSSQRSPPEHLSLVEETQNKHSLGDQRPENTIDSMESQVTLAGGGIASLTLNLQSQSGEGGGNHMICAEIGKEGECEMGLGVQVKDIEKEGKWAGTDTGRHQKFKPLWQQESRRKDKSSSGCDGALTGPPAPGPPNSGHLW